jgi:hypothetical protein
MRPLVQDEPAAVERLAAVERNGSISRVFLWSGVRGAGRVLAGVELHHQPAAGLEHLHGAIFGTCGWRSGSRSLR